MSTGPSPPATCSSSGASTNRWPARWVSNFVNGALASDAAIDPATPEALMNEVEPNGQLALLRVEHVVFQEAWDAEHADPPRCSVNRSCSCPTPTATASQRSTSSTPGRGRPTRPVATPTGTRPCCAPARRVTSTEGASGSGTSGAGAGTGRASPSAWARWSRTRRSTRSGTSACSGSRGRAAGGLACDLSVEAMGLEPTTYGLQSRRSRQLSYAPGDPQRYLQQPATLGRSSPDRCSCAEPPSRWSSAEAWAARRVLRRGVGDGEEAS